MDQDTQAEIKAVLQELLKLLEITAEIDTAVSEETLIFNLRTQDSGMLIGSRGANLEALQYLTRVLVNKKLQHPVHFILDAEGYKKSREEFLRELARQAAARVRETRETLVLKPMAAYERRVVHAEISVLSDVVSESQGDEPERRVVIKPKP